MVVNNAVRFFEEGEGSSRNFARNYIHHDSHKYSIRALVSHGSTGTEVSDFQFKDRPM